MFDPTKGFTAGMALVFVATAFVCWPVIVFVYIIVSSIVKGLIL